MFFQVGHGQRVVASSGARGARSAATSYPADAVEARQVYSPAGAAAPAPAARGAGMEEAQAKYVAIAYPVPDPDPTPQPPLEPRDVFRYLAKSGAALPTVGDAAARLDALAAAMAENPGDPGFADGESDIPAMMTYVGQFLDHDITLNTDGDGSEVAFNIDVPALAPASRDMVESNKLNLRRGTLRLDSVYGDGPNQSAAVKALEAKLRDPGDSAKMRLGQVTPLPPAIGFLRPVLPVDQGADIPRIGQAIGADLTEAQVRAAVGADATESQADLFRRPLIGDARNDENLIVAQTHLAFLRFHNAIVDKLRADGFAGSNDDLFKEARRQVTLVYQWLIANVYLKKVCDPAVVDQVIAARAPVYQAFHDAHKDSVPGGARPMPLEFSVAAFRFGHSMIRGAYDHNRNFGRPAAGDPPTSPPKSPFASFANLFSFTGKGGMVPVPPGQIEPNPPGADGAPSLPDNWIIDWERFVHSNTGDLKNRNARKIDTRLAKPLEQMFNQGPITSLMRKLAARNLRRGYVLNLPSAQGLLATLAADHGVNIAALTPAQLASGHTAAAVTAGGYDTATPLWFYLLKEAELAGGNHLGALGSRIVAETIIGLIVTDPNSFMNQTNPWDPSQAVQPKGEVLNTFSAMLRAGGVLSATGGV
jgi:hypothetical protein